MELSTRLLAEARDATASLLDELGLAAYLFEIEPRADAWELSVECAVAEGWETVRLTVDPDRLFAGRRDPAQRARLLCEWRRAIAACHRG